MRTADIVRSQVAEQADFPWKTRLSKRHNGNPRTNNDA